MPSPSLQKSKVGNGTVIMKKSIYLRSYGWPLFRELRIFVGPADVNRGASDGVDVIGNVSPWNPVPFYAP